MWLARGSFSALRELAEAERAVGVRQRRRARRGDAAVVGRPRRRVAVLSNEAGDVDAGHRVARHRPRRRHRPVAAVEQPNAVIGQALRLLLRQRHRRLDRGDEPRAHAAVVAEAIDVDAIGAASRCSILNEIVSPRLTLMSVAKPWIVRSPDPLMSHSVDGFPGLQFSATTRFAGRAHSGAASAGRCAWEKEVRRTKRSGGLKRVVDVSARSAAAAMNRMAGKVS